MHLLSELANLCGIHEMEYPYNSKYAAIAQTGFHRFVFSEIEVQALSKESCARGNPTKAQKTYFQVNRPALPKRNSESWRHATVARLLSASRGHQSSSFVQEDPIVGGRVMYPTKNIVGNEVNSMDNTTLASAAKDAELVDTFEGHGAQGVKEGHDKAELKTVSGACCG